MPARQASICGDGLPKLDIVFSDAAPGTNSPPPLTTATKKVSRFNVEELETNVRKLFATIDVTGNGYVTLREFERHLALSGVGLDWERVEQIYELIFCPAVDGDGAPSHCRLLTRWGIFLPATETKSQLVHHEASYVLLFSHSATKLANT
jgi:hypothetical protein